MADSPSCPTVFTSADRRQLTAALSQAASVRQFRRLQAVRHVAEGHSVSEAAQLVGVDRSTVHRGGASYLRPRRAATLADAPRAGRPREADDLDEEPLAELRAQDPRPLGYRATTWTAPLLTTHLKPECGCPVSERTLRRRLHEYGWRWKRLRSVFCGRDPHVGQKKGAFAAA